MTIVNVGYRSTNFWVVSAGQSRLLIDLGWSGTLGTFKANCERMDVPLSEIRYGVATHFHPDHAGLAQDLKSFGVRLLVADLQVAAIPQLGQWMKPPDRFTPIVLDDNVVVSVDDSRAVLGSIGIHGRLVHTPGHSDDSVSVLLDDGSVFTGDLGTPEIAESSGNEIAMASWRKLRQLGATTMYPGHGPVQSVA